MAVVALELVRALQLVDGPGPHLPELGVDVILWTAEGEHLQEGDDLVVAVALTETGRTVAADLDLDRVIARSTPHIYILSNMYSNVASLSTQVKLGGFPVKDT